MRSLPRFASAAHRWGRARRWFLLGHPAPFLARYAPDDLSTPDPAEDGIEAVSVWARWRMAEALDQGLRGLTSVRVNQGAQGGAPLGIAGALGAVAAERDREAAKGLLQSLTRAARAPGMELASCFARAADLAAERGIPRLVDEPELRAARELLAVTDEPVRDVLVWASLRAGRPRRAPLALVDILRILRNESLTELMQPAGDPWPALVAWRHMLGLEIPAVAEVAAEPEAWPGSWALRGRRSRLVGTSGWAGGLRARFALQGLGRLDVLSEGGHAVLLPHDAAAVQVLAAVYPMLLGEGRFLGRVFAPAAQDKGRLSDLRRLAALGELLLQRIQAAVVHLWSVFDQTREIEAVMEASGFVSRALHAVVAPELAFLLAMPWADGMSALPSVAMTGAGLIESWREAFDEDFWRNPRFAEPLRALASRAASEGLVTLAPEAHANGPKAYARWVEASLGD